jgi:hypothetical protein
VLAIFDHLASLVADAEFYGCHFLNIVYEMPEAEERARVQIKKQKDLVRDLFAELLVPVGKQGLADALYTLFEGALIGHKIHRDGWPIAAARRAAELLLGRNFAGVNF